MAKVSAHGVIIGDVAYFAKTRRYMSDGVILENAGHGWKRWGKVKPELAPEQAYCNARDRLAARLSANPALAEYRSLLHNLAGMGKRWKLHVAVSIMPDDADGVWSEACDGYGDNVCADIDDVSALCRAYRAAVLASKESAPL